MTEPGEVPYGVCPACLKPWSSFSIHGVGYCEREKRLDALVKESMRVAVIPNEYGGVQFALDDDRPVLGKCGHGVDLDREFCPKGCRV